MNQAATLHILGTGNAQAQRCFNTCFAIRTAQGVFLTDAGGGNGILPRLETAGIALTEIHDLFVTHAHTDHILGVIWVIRMVATAITKGEYAGQLHLYGHSEVIEFVDWVCRRTLPAKLTATFGNTILLHTLEDGDPFTAAGMSGRAFDIGSTKTRQFGYRLQLPNGKVLVCLGDEPYNARTLDYAFGADWLLSEAFCLYADRDRFKPYEKHHSTALDAGRMAAELEVKNLLLYHTEDKTLNTRRAAYTAEAAQEFNGFIHVPDDGDVLTLA